MQRYVEKKNNNSLYFGCSLGPLDTSISLLKIFLNESKMEPEEMVSGSFGKIYKLRN